MYVSTRSVRICAEMLLSIGVVGFPFLRLLIMHICICRKNPGSSYDMMQRLFMNMDLDLTLEKTIQNLDHCVGAAHVHSSYKGWLKRPLTKSELR